ncbi:protein translocase SEC61 complex subunit gamma [Candidatus Woesearchaeota archaeon]|nr:protein translocase SEC61 complex subunit gamma [Candidatus Woesearchaeota archaeon]
MKYLNRIKEFIVECKRVLAVTKKPDKMEFSTIVKVAGIGIIAIGLIGFLIQMIRQFIFGGF